MKRVFRRSKYLNGNNNEEISLIHVYPRRTRWLGKDLPGESEMRSQTYWMALRKWSEHDANIVLWRGMKYFMLSAVCVM